MKIGQFFLQKKKNFLSTRNLTFFLENFTFLYKIEKVSIKSEKTEFAPLHF